MPKDSNDNDNCCVITLVDEKGLEQNFKILDVIENNDGKFYALLPDSNYGFFVDLQENLIGTYELKSKNFYSYFIFKSLNDGREERLVEVFDDILLEKIGKIFKLDKVAGIFLKNKFEKICDKVSKEINKDSKDLE
ncbi:MAG: DUF1292 domain-containing protein [Oscillospiraceae bacterium]|jgi:hypothetical protein|nr:DUF1292 domain-containing protein [Oscillospiraceae bacterium]